MKIIILLIGSLISCFCSFCQTPVDSIVNFTLPKGTEKLTENQFQSFRKSHVTSFKSDQVKLNGEYYKINDLLVHLNGGYFNAPKNRLEYLKRDLDGQIKRMLYQTPKTNNPWLPDYTSEIKSINNYKVLIIHQDWGNSASYDFYTVNNSNTAVLNGSIDYYYNDKLSKESNKSKAAQTLDQMLKGMTFK